MNCLWKPGAHLARLVLCAATLTLAACAGVPATGENDPLEPFNRAMFRFNDALDEHVAAPVAQTYVHTAPEGLRTGIHNVIANLGAPVTFANDVLQGNFHRAVQTLWRFGINTTLGMGGIIDAAQIVYHIPPHTEDFGQTLGTYGVKEGFYLVLPFFGPSSLRDAVGDVADAFMDPMTYARFHYRKTTLITERALDVVDERANTIDTVEVVKSTAVDYYATVRSLYRQHRESEINNGEQPEDLPDM